MTVILIIPIWLLTHSLTPAAHVALIKPTRSHTCVTAQCQAPQPSDGSGTSHRTVPSPHRTAGVKRPLILYSQHVTTCYALVCIAEWSCGSVPLLVTLQYVQFIVQQLPRGCFFFFLNTWPCFSRSVNILSKVLTVRSSLIINCCYCMF